MAHPMKARSHVFGYVFLGIVALSLFGYLLARRGAIASVKGRQQELHSRLSYHGAFVAAWVGIPSLLLVLIGLLLQGVAIDRLLLWKFAPRHDRRAGSRGRLISC